MKTTRRSDCSDLFTSFDPFLVAVRYAYAYRIIASDVTRHDYGIYRSPRELPRPLSKMLNSLGSFYDDKSRNLIIPTLRDEHVKLFIQPDPKMLRRCCSELYEQRARDRNEPPILDRITESPLGTPFWLSDVSVVTDPTNPQITNTIVCSYFKRTNPLDCMLACILRHNLHPSPQVIMELRTHCFYTVNVLVSPRRVKTEYISGFFVPPRDVFLGY